MFRTELPLIPHPQQLPHSARVLTIGSCFSDSIGNRLADFKVATLVNPFGTVFNPISACKLLRAAAGEDMDWQQHVVEARGRWQSYDLHATLGADSPVELLQQIQRVVRDTGVFLATADAVVLTLGTAFAYRLQETQEIISNCHKLPAEKFEKELLSADEIIAAVAETHAYLRRINPRLRFILTVSPVRHLKETLPLSSVSKSMLRVACHYLSELLPDVSYFPAYELLMDDLRDYRFYAADMLHPSDVAENYIWERFTRTYFDTAFGRFKKEWESLRQALNHKPLHIAAPEHRQFLEGTLARLQRLSAQIDVRMEMLHVEKELAALPLPPPPPLPEPDEYEEDEELLDEELAPADAVDEAQARLLSKGGGILVESDGPEDEEDSTEANPEDAYESAYSGEALEYADEDEDASTEDVGEDNAAPEEELPVRKKKRRSRGGAKRNKRKAARLAAESEAAGVAPAEDAALGHSALGNTPPAVDEPEESSLGEGITYITEADLFAGASRHRPTEAAAPAAQAEPSSVSTAVPATDDVTEQTPESASQEPRRRNRPERQPRSQGNREPRRANRPPLYAVPITEEATPAPTETAPTPPEPAEAQPRDEAETSTAADPALTPAKPTSRSRGANRNRGNVGKDRVAQAAEVAATSAPVSARPVAEVASTDADAVSEAAATQPAADKPRTKRAPRKPTAPKPAAEASVPVPTETPAVAVSDDTLKPAPARKRPARKTAPAAQSATDTASEPDVAPAKKAPSRKKAAPVAPAAEIAAPAPQTPAPKRARPPRRKPSADAGHEATE